MAHRMSHIILEALQNPIHAVHEMLATIIKARYRLLLELFMTTISFGVSKYSGGVNSKRQRTSWQ